MKMKHVSVAIHCALLLAPALAFAEASNGDAGYGVATPGRLWASMDAAVGLISTILAGRALARFARREAILAAVVGLIVIAYAGLHLTIFTGGFGTGGGRAGAIVAIVLGLTSVVLAGTTLARSRRAS